MNTASTDILATAQQLAQQGQACALVTVLRVQAPASARPGDKAVVTNEGIVAGWIGGGCAQPAVTKTVRQALLDGKSRLIRITPSAEGEVRELEDVLEFGMACHSGGTLELFIDPLLPAARLVVVGDSPVAQALVALAPRVGFAVGVVAQGADPARFADAKPCLATDDAQQAAQHMAPGAFVVVATQGKRDVQGLRAALALQARQISFVASARKAQVLRSSLIEAGADAAAVNAIVAPAGHDIGAQTPEEIALSVLAALVSARRRGEAATPPHAPAVASTSPVAAGAAAALPAEPAPAAEVAPQLAKLSLAELLAQPLPGSASCCGGGGGGATAPAEPALQPADAAASASAPPKSSCCGG
jgi:xanthine dehydrogenase accessory factor